MHLLLAILGFYLPLLIGAGAALYHVAVLTAALRFSREKESPAGFTPPVSVLKPLHGIEEHFYATLATFFQQDYPSYEIVFGLSDAQDPARWTIAQLQRDFPNVAVKVVVATGHSGANPKIGKLRRMLEEASHDTVVISDADIRVERDYLRRVVSPLVDERVGLVTSLYRGAAGQSWGSILEALGMSADFAGQVLLARALGPIRFGLGATLATRKKQIEAIGGLAPWSDYLADDFILGNRIAQAGYRVHLSHAIVETITPRHTLREALQHQLRWARTIRACSPRGYLGLIFAYGAPLAIVPMLLHPESALATALMLGALNARWFSAWAAGVVVCRDRLVQRFFWLLPLRDILALGIWLLSYMGRQVVWRQVRYRLEADGRMRPV
jgi:ceramide glucosyltransferase